ncbi:discoidin domain-containing protein [Aliiglaciecola litoralis]|uniref:F5/8 type C domain-containing protein n=1 Tax=Aliiglaciecola litoralis TaxID=582857 RepID=A0ABN1LJZ1_9ALTE
MRKIVWLFTYLIASSVNAGVISISNVTASSTWSTYNVDNLINGSGLIGSLHSGEYTGKWMTNNTVTGSLLFDFGSVFDLTSSSIWNYGNGCCGIDRSVKDLSAEYSIDGITFFAIGDFILNQPVGDPFASETIALNASAQYIRFNLNSNYGSAYTGLSEVQFNGTAAAVPEPTSFVLLALGIAGLGFSRKKKIS